MPKADSNNTTTRRDILNGVVAVSLASGTAIAGAATANLALQPDPVFALIEANKRAWASFAASLVADVDDGGKACTAANDAFEALIAAEPTTFAGVAALLLYLKDFSDTEEWLFEEGVAAPLIASLAAAFRRMTPAGLSK